VSFTGVLPRGLLLAGNGLRRSRRSWPSSAASPCSPSSPAAENTAAQWEALSTDRGWAVVGKLMVMTLHPSSRARRFNAAKVVRVGRGIKWKVTAE
jgi:hypothetical protein